jgi:CelD/BcsL family acetyltransferase involved in cellulose biosynthesis
MKHSAQALLKRHGPYCPDPIADTQKQEREGTESTFDTTRVRTIRIENWNDVSDLEAAWTALLNRAPGHSGFQTVAWNVCWWKAFRGSHELFVILAYAGSGLVGIAPMMITQERGPFVRVRRHVRFIGSINATSDYCDFITDPDVSHVLHALLDEMSVSSGGVHRVDLSHFPSHSPNRARLVEYFRRQNERFTIEFQAEAPVRILGDLQADLKVANKKSLKKDTNFFTKSGLLRFQQCRSEGEIQGYLDVFFEQHKSRWGSRSQFFDPAQQVFYRELVRRAFCHGWLRFDAMLFNGVPLAFHFGFEYRRRFIGYKTTFHVQFASRSPGGVLIKFLLDDAIRRRLEEFDFTAGSEAYKYRFANRIRTNERVIAFHSAGDYWIHRTIRRGKTILKKLMRRNALAKGSAESAQLIN